MKHTKKKFTLLVFEGEGGASQGDLWWFSRTADTKAKNNCQSGESDQSS